MSKFNLKINGEKVDLNGIKGGIKRENIQDEKMLTIFDAFDKEGGSADQVLSDNEVKEMLGFVKKRAQHNNPRNLGDKEFNKLLKKFSKKLGVNLENVSKAEFLQFIKTLDEVSKNPAPAEVKPVEQEEAEVAQEQPAVVPEQDNFEPVCPEKPAVIKKVSQPKAWQNSNPKNVEFNSEEDDTAEKVLAKLMQANGIKAEDVQMGKLKADLIKYNPSLFEPSTGTVYRKPDWSKLDFPEKAGELYANGKQPPVAEKSVPKTAAKKAATKKPSVAKPADKPAENEAVQNDVPENVSTHFLKKASKVVEKDSKYFNPLRNLKGFEKAKFFVNTPVPQGGTDFSNPLAIGRDFTTGANLNLTPLTGVPMKTTKSGYKYQEVNGKVYHYGKDGYRLTKIQDKTNKKEYAFKDNNYVESGERNGVRYTIRRDLNGKFISYKTYEPGYGEVERDKDGNVVAMHERISNPDGSSKYYVIRDGNGNVTSYYDYKDENWHKPDGTIEEY